MNTIQLAFLQTVFAYAMDGVLTVLALDYAKDQEDDAMECVFSMNGVEYGFLIQMIIIMFEEHNEEDLGTEMSMEQFIDFLQTSRKVTPVEITNDGEVKEIKDE